MPLDLAGHKGESRFQSDLLHFKVLASKFEFVTLISTERFLIKAFIKCLVGADEDSA